MGDGSAVDWEPCEADGCVGVQLPSGGRCWAHAAKENLDAALGGIRDRGGLDARGVTFTAELLHQVLAAADHSDGPVTIRDAKLDGATFPEDTHFGRVTFEGEASFFGATFQGDVWFDGATFSGRAEFHGATFSGDAWFDGATFSDRGGFGAATFAGNAGFHGATFLGDAEFDGATFHRIARFDEARFQGAADFDRATFSSLGEFNNTTFMGAAWFYGTTFTAPAQFDRARFMHRAAFAGASFGEDAVFFETRFTDDAEFGETIFTGRAGFSGASFDSDAEFDRATFSGGAEFDRATFMHRAAFAEASFGDYAVFVGTTFTDDTVFGNTTFSGNAGFSGASFGANAEFYRATFSGRAGFSGASFGGDAEFDGATFSRDVTFRETTFTGRAWFGMATFERDADFDRATFEREAAFTSASMGQARQLGPMWVGEALVLDGALFRERIQIEVGAAVLSCRRTRFLAGAQLRVRWANVVLDGAELAVPSVLDGFHGPPDVDWGRVPQSDWLVGPDGKPRLWSVRGADVGGLTIAAVDLQACRFVGTHHLDQLRAEGSGFAETPLSWRWAKRRIIAEEQEWRGWHGPAQEPHASLEVEPLGPAQIAPLYRDLRKGLEDSKDEPGAADFYYGEMEMRRHAKRRQIRGEQPNARVPNRRFDISAATEWAILTLYWLVSGYGLRAWRALATLAAVVLVASVVLAFWGFDRTAGLDELPTALLVSTQATTALLRGTETRALTTLGEWLQIALRLIGPVLLGLAVLSVRGRVKR